MFYVGISARADCMLVIIHHANVQAKMPVEGIGKGINGTIALARKAFLPMFAHGRGQFAESLRMTVGYGAIFDEVKWLIQLQIFCLERRPDISGTQFLASSIGNRLHYGAEFDL